MPVAGPSNSVLVRNALVVDGTGAPARHGDVAVIDGRIAAVGSSLAASGLPTDKFIFLGFLQKKAGKRRSALRELMDFDGTIIIYESPFRVVKCLQDIFSVLGDRQVAAARELTKVFEEVVRGKVSEVLKRFEGKPPKGEFVILIKSKD